MHQKRLSAPNSWPIERKENKWTTKAGSGPHGEKGVPLVIILRDVLGYANNKSEVQFALNNDAVLINGQSINDESRPIGIFDILSFPDKREYYRVVPDEGGKLSLSEIDKRQADTRLGKIIRKQQVTGGDFQYTTHDGTNIRKDSGSLYNTGDSLVLETNSNQVVDHFPYTQGALTTVINGQHAGEVGRIEEIAVTLGSGANTVTIRKNGELFETIEDYLIVVDEEFMNPNGHLDMIEIEITEEDLSGQIEALVEEFDLSPEEISKIESTIDRLVEQKMEEHEVTATDEGTDTIKNILAAVLRKEYPQITE